MKTIASPLNIIDFSVLNFEQKFIVDDSGAYVDNKSFYGYPLDIDFNIRAEETIQVFIKASINKEKIKKPGYSIVAEVVCFFEFNKNVAITEEVKKSIEGFSTIYIAINCLRGFISQFTANGPIGRYILPSIDLNDLISKKQKEGLKKEKQKIAIKEKTK